MKFETVARKLAAKTGTPILEDIILGKRPLTDLPSECMIWTGGTNIREGRQHRARLHRDYNKRPYIGPVRDAIYGRIKVEGREILAHRYVYTLLFKPTYEFRLVNECGNSLCCNPIHWAVHSEVFHPPENGEVPEVDFSLDWSLAEVMSLLEQALGAQALLSWDEVINNPLLMDCPHQLLIEGLTEIGKKHLLP